MASRASVAKKIKIRDLPKIDVNVYSMIVLNNLVVYAVYYLQEHGVTATVEETVWICFRLFPQSFALKNYPRWPDSALVARLLNEGREEGYLKGNSVDGFSLKYKGKQLAQRVAKVLGLIQPAPARTRKKVTPTNKAIALVKPVKVKEKGTRIISHGKKVVALVARKKMPDKPSNRPLKKVVPGSARSSSQVIKAKQETLPLIKMEEKPRQQAAKLPARVPVKKVQTGKKQQKQVVRKVARSEQLTLALPVQQEKKAKIIAPVMPGHITKEEKAKAGKFVRLMERSDAYIHYKKNGRNSKIGEFDFRSLLLCTMESSHETLAKNMGLFKGYAGIHNRQDLLIFLEFCEDRFSHLLKPQNKPARKTRR